MRDAPITPAFVAMKRIVAARIPTYTLRMSRKAPEMPRFSTSPSTGSLAKPPSSGGRPSSVWYSPFTNVTGSAERAIAGSVK
jgi:hypothetical protein